MASHPDTPHTVRSFDEDLNALRLLVSRMGGLTEAQVTASVEALINRDTDAALRVVSDDAIVDAMEREVEALVMSLFARRAPVADDLRQVIAALKISAELERIADYAKNIAKRATTLSQTQPVQPTVIVPQMARLVTTMLKEALDAYVDRDAGLAAQVLEEDRSVDDLYASLFRSLLTYMMENPHHITPSAHLLFIAKNLERMGDHATNIAEMVEFGISGKHGTPRPRGTDTAFLMSRDADVG